MFYSLLANVRLHRNFLVKWIIKKLFNNDGRARVCTTWRESARSWFNFQLNNLLSFKTFSAAFALFCTTVAKVAWFAKRCSKYAETHFNSQNEMLATARKSYNTRKKSFVYGKKIWFCTKLSFIGVNYKVEIKNNWSGKIYWSVKIKWSGWIFHRTIAAEKWPDNCKEMWTYVYTNWLP